MDKTLLKLEQILKDNQKEIDKEKSSYWKKGVRDHNFYDYTTSLRSGSFTPRTFKQLIYNYLNQRLYFNNINGFNVFTSEVYKKTQQIAKIQNRVLDYDFLRMVYTYLFLIEQKQYEPYKICIIGDGKANLTSIFLKMGKNIKIYYINLVEVMIQDYQILKKGRLINTTDYVLVEKKEDLKNNCNIYFIPRLIAK